MLCLPAKKVVYPAFRELCVKLRKKNNRLEKKKNASHVSLSLFLEKKSSMEVLMGVRRETFKPGESFNFSVSVQIRPRAYSR